jgi:phosphate transport system substrate-binding protein
MRPYSLLFNILFYTLCQRALNSSPDVMSVQPARLVTSVLFTALLVMSGCVEPTARGSVNSGSGAGESLVSIQIAGSSTVYPLATGWAEAYRDQGGNYTVAVAGGGSGAGAAAVCSTSVDHVDIGSMSRSFKPVEATLIGGERFFECRSSDVLLTQIPIAMDGITVIVSKGGSAEQCLSAMGGISAAQLRWMYSDWTEDDLAYSQYGGLEMSSVTPNNDGDDVREWRDLFDDAACADERINLWGPDAQSGTYEYFGERILCPKCFLGEYGYPVEGYYPRMENSADDNVIINGVSRDDLAIGFFGYAYYEAHQAVLTAIGVSANQTHGANDAIEPVVDPSSTTIRNESYHPLSREIYLVVDNASWERVLPFLEFGFSEQGQTVIGEVGYVPLPESTYSSTMAILEAQKVDVSESNATAE